MRRKFGTFINPAIFGFGTLHDFLDYLGKCGHIKLEFGFVKSVENGNFDNHGAGYESDKFFRNDVEAKKSGHFFSEEKDAKNESARFLSEDEDVKLLSATADYYEAFPGQAQPESHQLLHYRHTVCNYRHSSLTTKILQDFLNFLSPKNQSNFGQHLL